MGSGTPPSTACGCARNRGAVTLGLTDYGVALFGDIFAFTPKRLGLHIEADRSLGVVEFAKAAASAKVRLPVRWWRTTSRCRSVQR